MTREGSLMTCSVAETGQQKIMPLRVTTSLSIIPQVVPGTSHPESDFFFFFF